MRTVTDDYEGSVESETAMSHEHVTAGSTDAGLVAGGSAEPDADLGVMQESASADGGTSFIRWFAELVVMIGVAFLLATGIRTFVVQPYYVPTGSMLPTIQLFDRVIANKFIYRFEDPTVGDIVVCDDPQGRLPTLIKRVVAVGGQTVDLVDGAVVIDGQTLDEPYTHGLPTEPQVLEFPYVVPEDTVWLMGDNRTNSTDSRSFGPVALSDVHGQAFFRYWPFDRVGALDGP